jgi:N-acetylneuraminic acid mutarotase
MKRVILIIFVAMTEINCFNSKIVHGKAEIEWSVAAVLPSPDGITEQPGLAGPVTGIIDNRLLVSGGANFPDGMPWHGAKKVYHDEIYFFEKKNEQIVTATVSKQKLPQPVAYCATVTIPGGLVYLGGENEQGISDKVVFVKYNAASNKIEFSDLPSLPLPLTNLSAAYNGHIIYAGGGNSKEG